MSDKFSAPAKALWVKIPPDIQERLLNNVWCSQCAAMTIITNFTGSTKDGDLILIGSCIRCGNPVTRLIEGE